MCSISWIFRCFLGSFVHCWIFLSVLPSLGKVFTFSWLLLYLGVNSGFWHLFFALFGNTKVNNYIISMFSWQITYFCHSVTLIVPQPSSGYFLPLMFFNPFPFLQKAQVHPSFHPCGLLFFPFVLQSQLCSVILLFFLHTWITSCMNHTDYELSWMLQNVGM